jgi:hypothetical protein
MHAAAVLRTSWGLLNKFDGLLICYCRLKWGESQEMPAQARRTTQHK